MKNKDGFTLVELAIVLMIIGLLIGAVLKGQEMITNARVTSTIRLIKSSDAAVFTFMDSYGIKPGDMTDPATRLPNCSTASCNIAGNGNGNVGPMDARSDENNTFWLHLAAANLISGIDMASAWTSSTYLAASFPKTAINSILYVISYADAPNSYYLNGLYGHHWLLWGATPAGNSTNIVPLDLIGKIDRKMDDGKPWQGEMGLASTCGVTAGAADYPTISTLCTPYIKTAF